MQPAADSLSPAPARRVRRDLVAAVARGDLDAADAALDTLGEPLSRDLVEPAAMLHLARERWSAAAAALDRLPRREAPLEALRRYARNRAAIAAHHPHLDAALRAAPEESPYEIADNTVVARLPDGRAVGVVGDPAAHLARVRELLRVSAGESVGLAGIGDGRVVRDLAEHPPAGALGAEQGVLVLEPDAGLFRACLLLHDLADPLTQPRFTWCIGDDWAGQLERATREEDQLPLPTRLVTQSPRGDAIMTRFRELLVRLETDDQTTGRALAERYASRSRAWFAQAFRGAMQGGKGGRPPRVLFMTSRFTTVLQHSTRDAAEAFERLGWQTRVLIESANHHRLTGRHIRRHLHAFDPDLVFVIDHHRWESGDLFPPQLPFLCWIQDNLPNLTTARAGASLGACDFAIGAWVRNYVRDHGYPARQCITMQRVTNAPAAPPLLRPDGDDLLYVSNHAQPPAARLAEVVESFAGQPAAQNLAAEAGRRMIATYAAGGSLGELREVAALVGDVSEELAAGPPEPPEAPGIPGAVAWRLFDRVNNALYRQQALGWAADVAERLGLRLSIRGSGWERHERFARFAGGPIAYGQPLADATRRARFSLMLEPYSPTSHQRVLDGWLAGGFFLLRRRPIDAMQAAWIGWLGRLPADVETLDAARRVLDPEAFAEFERLHAAMHVVDPSYADLNLMALHRARERDGLGFLMAPPPHDEEVSFADAAGLESLIRRFTADDAERARLAAAQGAFVRDHFTYDAGLRRVIDRVADLLASDSAPDATPLCLPL